MRSPEWTEPADMYAITAELRVLAHRLPQASGQLAAGLDGPAVVYASDDGEPPANVVVAARRGLFDAAGHAEAMRAALERAQDALSHLYGHGHGGADGPEGK